MKILELIWVWTVEPWRMLFGQSHETGNGSGVFGMLVALAMIGVQAAALVIAGVVGLIVWSIVT